MKIYLYLQDNGDGSTAIFWYKSEEDRQKHADRDEKLNGYTIDGACDYTVDTDNMKWDEPLFDEDEEDEE